MSEEQQKKVDKLQPSLLFSLKPAFMRLARQMSYVSKEMNRWMIQPSGIAKAEMAVKPKPRSEVAKPAAPPPQLNN